MFSLLLKDLNFFLLLLAHLSRRLTGELIVYTGIRRPSVVRPSVVRQHFQTTSPLKPSGGFFPYYTYIASIGRGNEKLCFLFRSDKTLVAMATYSSHRLIMGKVEFAFFFLSQWRYLDFFFLQKCLLSSPLCFI